MKNNIHMITLSAALVGGLMFVVPSVSAHMGGMKGGRALADKAQILGMTEEDLKTQLQSKSFDQIAKEKGVTQQELQQKMRTQYEQELQNQGLSQDDITSRMKRWDTWRRIHTEVQEQRIKSIASALGKSVEELKKELETKSMRQILTDNGLMDSSEKGRSRNFMHGM